MEKVLVDKDREKNYKEISTDYVEYETNYGENRQGREYRRESGNRNGNWNNDRNRSRNRSGD